MAMFSKQVTKSDMEKSLLIPTQSLESLPFEQGHFFYMNVIDPNSGTAWTFPCFIQQVTSEDEIGSKGSSVISVGWLSFLRNRDVRVGDMVFLHPIHSSLDNNNNTNCTGKMTTTDFRIQVKRKLRLLGQDFWAAL